MGELPWGEGFGDQLAQSLAMLSVRDKDHAPELVETGCILSLLAAPPPLLRDVLMLEPGAVVQHPLDVLMVGEEMGAYGG